mmetsp:Transcript_53123/g.124237  ORF Transcript_53123/g.124237 Transcript_53123/m.124237 type:complete len:261 (-) Transcript_53123:111-893(-)
MRVLDHDDCGIDHGADGDGDTPERHDVGVQPLLLHHQEGRHHAQRQRDDCHQRRAQVPQENHADQGDHRKLFEQLHRQVVDGALNQGAAVIGRDDLDTLRQAGLQLLELVLDRGNRRLGVLAVAQDHHAADRLAFAVQFGDATAHLRSDLHGRDLAQQHRHAVAAGQHDAAEFIQRLQEAAGAHHVLGLGQLQHGAASLLVAVHQRLAYLVMRDPVGDELGRVDHHLVLLDHAAHRGHLGHVGDGLQLELEEPILQRPQL